MRLVDKPVAYQIIERKTVTRTGVVAAPSWTEAEEKSRYAPEEIEWQDEELISSDIVVDLL
tara:strand:- start:1757 stop:1939 length:183 start_codon:yes stop_codon:yes gene_type:complete